MPALAETLGINVRHYRKLRNLSQEELAAKTGISRGTIALYESGKAGATLDSIAKLASALEVEETDLVYPGKAPEPVVVTPPMIEMLDKIKGLLSDLNQGKINSPLVREFLSSDSKEPREPR